MNNRFLFGIVLIFLIFVPSVYSLNLNVSIQENVTAISISDSQFSLSATGQINITNPTTSDFIHQFGFEFRNDVVLSYTFANYTFIEDGYEIRGNEIFPNTTLTLNYTLSGIIPDSDFVNYRTDNTTVLDWYSEDIFFEPIRDVRISKYSRENASNTTESGRLVVVDGTNPTEFNVTVDYVNLIKTNATNSGEFYESDKIISIFSNFSLGEYEYFKFDYFDNFSRDDSAYWVQTRLTANYNLTNNFSISITVIDPNTGGVASGGSTSGVPLDFLSFKDLIIRKSANVSRINHGQQVEITLKIQNPNLLSAANLQVIDTPPAFFDILDGNNPKALQVGFGGILPFETKKLTYVMNFSGFSGSHVIPVPPARLNFNDKVVFSNLLNLVNINKTNEVLLIEKQIVYLDNGQVRTIITVKNIGDVAIKNIKLVEGLRGDLAVSGNRKFKRQWLIPKLDVGEKWEVSYESDVEDLSFAVPDAFAGKNTKIFKTMIVNEQIIETYDDYTNETYISLLIGLAVIFVILDLLF